MKIFFIILSVLPTVVFGQPQFNRDYEVVGQPEGFCTTIYQNGSYFTSGVVFYGSNGKYYLIELNTNGDTLRKKLHGKPTASYYLGSNSLFSDDSNFIFIGKEVDTNGTFPFVSKMNFNFDTIWTSYKWNLPEGDFFDAKKTRDGYVFAGMHDSTTTNFDILIVKCDTSGNLQWKKKIVTNEYEYAYSIDTTLDGGFVIAGWQRNAISWNSSWDIYITKLDSAGSIASGWPKVFGTTDSEAGWVRTLKDGSFAVWGGWESGSGNEKAHLRKLFPNGNTAWIQNFQNPGASAVIDVFTDLVEVENGDLVLTGMFYDSTINNPVGWILRTDSLGNEKWRRKLQKRNEDNYLYSIQQTPDLGFVMSGFVFPDGGSTTQDGWIIKVDSMGCLTPGCWVGMEEFSKDIHEFQIIPNPNNGNFEICAIEKNNKSKALITVSDVYGRAVWHKEMDFLQSCTHVQMPGLSPGLYFICMDDGSLKITQPIIID
ncbi:MAG: T9SS type A sorting domain-containing protein [Bacteroidota bacterium]